MAIALNIIHLGESPATTQAMQGDVNNTVLPAGSTLATATSLGAAINDIATTPSGSGVTLPANATTVGDQIFVYNGSGSNSLRVYPALSTENINAGAAGSGFIITVNRSASFTRTQNLTWRAILSA